MRYWLTFGIIIIILMASFNWVELSITKNGVEESMMTPYGSLAMVKYENTIVGFGIKDIPLHKELLRSHNGLPGRTTQDN